MIRNPSEIQESVRGLIKEGNKQQVLSMISACHERLELEVIAAILIGTEWPEVRDSALEAMLAMRARIAGR